MQFDEADTTPFKTWLVTRLEDISDADSDVLGDYVLALVKSEEPEDEVRANCLTALEDFLGDHTQKFVADVFEALRTKSYMPGYVAPRPQQAPPPALNTPTGPSAITLPAGQNGGVPFGSGGRKRDYDGGEGVESTDRRDPHYGDRAQKAMRRGNQRGGLQNGNSGRSGYNQPMAGSFPGAAQYPDMGSLFNPPSGFPPLDPNNPMAAIMAMQAMGLPPLPGFPTFPAAGPPLGMGIEESRLSNSLVPVKVGERCRDYDTKGFCAAGSMCPYEHGADRIIVPGVGDEYDPRQASLPANFNSSPTHKQHFSQGRQFDNSRPPRGGRGGGRGNQNGGVGQSQRGRAAFSSHAPNHDRSIMSIVVESIPEEHFSDEAIRAFFAEFGSIEEVTMQPYKRLAIVRYADYNAAKRAYDSPKVIFDNRFVKVYWYKPELATHRSDGAHAPKEEAEDEPMVDVEAFALKQAEAQRVHEEKAKKLKEAESQKEELERRIKAQAEARRQLLEKLAKKTGSEGTTSQRTNVDSSDKNTTSTTASTTAMTTTSAGGKTSAQTEALRAKLAELEAEAETLGLSPHDEPSSYHPSSTYRGRGRGTYNPRARGGSSYPYAPRGGRGGGRGGAWAGFAGHTGAVARLDNRPKSVSVLASNTDVNFEDGAVSESLRGFLFGVGEFGEVMCGAAAAAAAAAAGGDASGKPDVRKNRAVVRFNERYVAEEFIRRAGGVDGIPGLGKVELAWVANAPISVPSASMSMNTASGAGKLDAGAATFVPGGGGGGAVDVDMGDSGDKSGAGRSDDREMDYDVADDDDDRWAR